MIFIHPIILADRRTNTANINCKLFHYAFSHLNKFITCFLQNVLNLYIIVKPSGWLAGLWRVPWSWLTTFWTLRIATAKTNGNQLRRKDTLLQNKHILTIFLSVYSMGYLVVEYYSSVVQEDSQPFYFLRHF